MVRPSFCLKYEEIKRQKCGRGNKKAKLAAQSHESRKELEGDRTNIFRTVLCHQWTPLAVASDEQNAIFIYTDGNKLFLNILLYNNSWRLSQLLRFLFPICWQQCIQRSMHKEEGRISESYVWQADSDLPKCRWTLLRVLIIHNPSALS